MSPHRPETKGFLRRHNGNLYVGAEDLSDPKNPYKGPVAEVYVENATWLRIVADRYDNHLMLNVEALPYLKKALSEIERTMKRAVR